MLSHTCSHVKPVVTWYPSGVVCVGTVPSSVTASFLICHICQQPQKLSLFRNETSHCKSAFCKTEVFCVHGFQQPSRYKRNNIVVSQSVLFFSLSHLHLCFLSFQGMTQRNELSSEVGIVGQRVTYSNGTIKIEDPSPPLIKPVVRESVRALKHGKGQSMIMSNRTELFPGFI